MLQMVHVVVEHGIRRFMVHFYGEIRGNTKTIATRCGSKNSGMYTHIRSWDKGIEVICFYDKSSNKNIFRIYETGGSNYPHRKK